MAFHSVGALLNEAAHMPLWEAVLADDCRDRGVERAESLERMGALWRAMVRSAAEYDPARRSASGLSGGQAAKMAGAGETLCGPYMQRVMETALRVAEQNACMGRIVAAVEARDDTVLLVTADHGNADCMFDESGKVNTAHTTNPVPFAVCRKGLSLKPGRLADIAPTILALMGLEQPAEMTGENLIVQ